jgi:hypothetical protein
MTYQPVLAAPDPQVVREELCRLVFADLLGPLDGEHEEFPREDPLDRRVTALTEGGVVTPHATSLRRERRPIGSERT